MLITNYKGDPYVKNADKTNDLSPQGFSSWLEYWENYPPKKIPAEYCCPACGNHTQKCDLVGAHVEKVGSTDKQMYIVPLCRTCNSKKEQLGMFSVDATLLVPSNL